MFRFLYSTQWSDKGANDFLIASFPGKNALNLNLSSKQRYSPSASSWMTTRLTLLLKKNEGCKASTYRVFRSVFVNYEIVLYFIVVLLHACECYSRSW